MADLLFKDEFYRIKKACIEVRRNLGNGFLEKVYENALAVELEAAGFEVKSQQELQVYYKDHRVGDYYADLVLDNKIIIELKCCGELLRFHKAQLLNYLKATGYKLGILINFPPDVPGFEIVRVPFLRN